MAHVPTAAVIGGSVAVGSVVVPGISVVSMVVVVLAVAAEAAVGAVIVTPDASVLVFDPWHFPHCPSWSKFLVVAHHDPNCGSEMQLEYC
jgi:hypothetical protein